jgi:prepilin-type N-terminal cleavage/methylation domain-containing protein
MITHRGFSLIEVLVSLLLLTRTSIALLKQQWQISQDFNQISQSFSKLIENENTKERKLCCH